jgi:hypothetical protein
MSLVQNRAKTAQLLEHTSPPETTLTLISQDNLITRAALLPEVVGASIMPGHVIALHRPCCIAATYVRRRSPTWVSSHPQH